MRVMATTSAAVVGRLTAGLEIVDVGGTAIGGEQRAVAGDQGAVGAGAERQPRRRQGDEATHHVGGDAHGLAVGVGAGCDERRARGRRRHRDPDGRQHVERRLVEPLEVAGAEDLEASRRLGGQLSHSRTFRFRELVGLRWTAVAREAAPFSWTSLQDLIRAPSRPRPLYHGGPTHGCRDGPRCLR